MIHNVYARAKGQLLSLLKTPLDHLRYQYVYPLIERLTYKQRMIEASQNFEQNSKQRQKSEGKIPFHISSKQNKVFQEYCVSDLDEYGFEKNKTSLCFVLGPQGVGKSSFIKFNMQRLFQSKAKKISNGNELPAVISRRPLEDTDWFNIASFNCGALQIINFDTFLNSFEKVLINSIVSQLNKIEAKPKIFPQLPGEDPFDPIKIVKDLIYYNYAKEFINVYARDMVQAIINDADIAVYLSDTQKPALSEIFSKKMVEESVDFSEVFEDIVQITSTSFEGDSIRAAVNIGVSLMARLEYENRSPELKDSFNRTGVLVNTFLFDLLNYLEGYHVLNKVQRQFSQNVVLLENFDSLFKGYSTDIRFYNFQDHLFMRLHDDSKERTHFPVVIETSNSRFFTRELYEMMHIPYTMFGVIELYGIPVDQLPPHFSPLFSTKEVNIITKIIGTNPSSWTDLLLSAKAGQKMQFKDFINMKNEHFEKEYTKFLSAINSIYLDNTLSSLLDGVDKQDVDFYTEKTFKDPSCGGNVILFYILDLFEAMIYNFGTLQLESKYAEQRILENFVVKALLSANIVYSRYYYSYMTFNKYQYLTFSKRFVKEHKQKMTVSEKLQYLRWRYRNGIEKKSLIVEVVLTSEKENQPINSKSFFIYKLESELLQFKGIDWAPEYENLQTTIFNALFKPTK